MELKEKLRLLRADRHETQTQVAASIGITGRQHQRFEAGEILPGFEILCALADHFRVSLDCLAGKSSFRERLP